MPYIYLLFFVEVVSSKIFDNDEELKTFNARLANYFLKCGKDDYRICKGILTYLQKAEMNSQIVQYFRTDRRSLRITDIEKSYALRVNFNIFLNLNSFCIYV